MPADSQLRGLGKTNVFRADYVEEFGSECWPTISSNLTAGFRQILRSVLGNLNVRKFGEHEFSLLGTFSALTMCILSVIHFDEIIGCISWLNLALGVPRLFFQARSLVEKCMSLNLLHLMCYCYDPWR